MRKACLTAVLIFALMSSFSSTLCASSYSVNVSTDKTYYLRGDRVTVSGHVYLDSSPASGVWVGIEVRSPSGAVVWLDQVTADSSGAYASSFTLSLSAEYGLYTVYAAVPGFSVTTSFRVVRPSSITLTASPLQVSVGGTVTISGQVEPARQTQVTIYISSDETYQPLATVATSSDGSFSYDWNPTVAGTYRLKAASPSDDEYLPAESQEVAVEVSKLPSSITCSLSTTTIRLGESVTITGRIEQGVAGTVIIEAKLDDVWSELAQVQSSLNGSYSYQWTPSREGTFLLRAKWLGNTVYEAAISSEQALTVLSTTGSETSIALWVAPTTTYVGCPVKLEGALTPPIGSVDVFLSMYFNGAWTTLTTVTADLEGRFAYNFTPSVAGIYRFKASWQGNVYYAGAESNAVTVTVVKRPSTLTLQASPSLLEYGQTVIIHGILQPAIHEAQVALTFTSPSGTNSTMLAQVEDDGTFSYTFSPSQVGAWSLEAYWPGNDEYEPAYSSPITFTVTRAATHLELYVEQASTLGETIEIEGYLTPPLQTQLELKLLLDEVVVEAATVTVQPTGAFAYNWTPSQTGLYRIVASFQGDPYHEPSSNASTVFIAASTAVIEAPFPIKCYLAGSEAVSMSFDEDTATITLKVEGPSSLEGQALIIISQQLLNLYSTSIGRAQVFVNGTPAPFTWRRINDAYHLYINYTHSLLEIEVSLISLNLTAQVLDHNGQPLSGAAVQVFRKGMPLYVATASSEGIVHLTNIASGNYTIKTYWLGVQVESSSLHLNSSETLTIRCQVYELRVSVEDLVLGQPLPNIDVRVTSDNIALTVKTNASGEALFAQLPRGTYRVIATTLGLTAEALVELNLDVDVTLKLPTALSLALLASIPMAAAVTIVLLARKVRKAKK